MLRFKYKKNRLWFIWCPTPAVKAVTITKGKSFRCHCFIANPRHANLGLTQSLISFVFRAKLKCNPKINNQNQEKIMFILVTVSNNGIFIEYILYMYFLKKVEI